MAVVRLGRKILAGFAMGTCLMPATGLSVDSQSGLTRTQNPEGLEFFEKKIRPALHTHCLECHGDKKQKGGLRLDFSDGWKIGGDSGPAIIPHQPASSLLIEAIAYHNKELEMPPDGRLPAPVIEDFRHWVSIGAPDPRVAGPGIIGSGKQEISLEEARSFWSFQPLAEVAVPEIEQRDWPATPVDAFILRKLEQHDLEPSPEADRHALVRRLYFDLIGLPPTPEQINNFTGNDSPDAWSSLVEELLASRHFGERWGRHWLDVVRFAESSGGGRTLLFPDAWRYRDYVMDAFNEDMPYDRFLMEQLAGDLMEASDWLDRRRKLVATGFLLLGPTNYELQDKDILEMDIVDEQLDTLGKAVMGMTLGCARCHDHKFDPIPTADYYAMAGIFKNTHAIIHSNVSTWNKRELPQDPQTTRQIALHRAALASAKDEHRQLTGELKAMGDSIGIGTPPTLPDGFLSGKNSIIVDNSGALLTGPWVSSTHTPGFIGSDYLHDNRNTSETLTASFTPDIPNKGHYDIYLSYTPGSNRATAVPVTITTPDETTAIVIDQKTPGKVRATIDLIATLELPAGMETTVTVSNQGVTDGHVIVDAVIFAERREPGPGEAAMLARRMELTERIAAVEERIKQLESASPVIPVAMAVDEEETIADIPIAIRGVVSNRGPVVKRGVMKVTAHLVDQPEVPADTSGRLQLSQWLTDPAHPLTSRVMANRIWYWLFGRGIVPSVDNFGKMGNLPSHPELLDYLAQRFIDSGWSVKDLIREIVNSRTYRMSSQLHDQGLSADPDNNLLWHMPRRRLDAESIRDSLLAAASSLDLTYGGSHIKPGTRIEYGYEFDSSRRSVYLPVFRNTLPEIFETFDFADPNMMNGRRNVSAVATQALMMMNSPFVIEKCREAARALLSTAEGSTGTRQLIQHAFLQTLGRQPTAAEMEITTGFISNPDSPETDPEQRWALLYQSLFQSIDFRYLR